MRNLGGALLLALGLVVGGCAEPEPKLPVADTIYHNGYVYTVDGARHIAQAVALRGDRIEFVGSDADAFAYKGADTRMVNLEGRMMMPGLHDAHVHPLGVVQPDICDLASEPMPLAALVGFLQECIERYRIAPGEWMVVPQWSFAIGNDPDAQYPTLRSALDAASSEHPILLRGQ